MQEIEYERDGINIPVPLHPNCDYTFELDADEFLDVVRRTVEKARSLGWKNLKIVQDADYYISVQGDAPIND